MLLSCRVCHTTFDTIRAYQTHAAQHKHPRPFFLGSKKLYHPHLNARPCNAEGEFLPDGTPPPEPAEVDPNDFDPFLHRPQFEFAYEHYVNEQSSESHVNSILKILQAAAIAENKTLPTLFDNYEDMLNHIDAIPVGDAKWYRFVVRYDGPVDDNSPPWKRRDYVVWTRDPRVVLRHILANREFDGKFDYIPYKEYLHGSRIYSHFFSGQWSWRHADMIAADVDLRGAMMVPIIQGADKTTVSVGTGGQEFHPVYVSVGNVSNEVRRAHGEAVVPIAFLAIPKGTKEDEADPEFRLFKKQLYHTSLAHILSPIRSAMTKPIVMKCPDGHYRRVIFEIGPFIANYPEQVYLSGIVSGYCPKCTSAPGAWDNGKAGDPRTREFDKEAKETCEHNPNLLWDTFGIVPGLEPFTTSFPRADIHEILSPDLLHQLIKGTFKDHLVTWVLAYINAHNDGPNANKIIDDIDRRLAAVPDFPGLRRFAEGRNFKQWTGNDSKALMKIFIPAIVGYVPDRVVMCLASFMSFCYLARRSSHNMDSLAAMEHHLIRFHELRDVFKDLDIREDFALPRQHALVHYVNGIRLFGALNGLCSSITESKHIKAVKEPWRRSNRKEPLPQMLQTLVRLSKMTAQRIYWGIRGMLQGSVLEAVAHAAVFGNAVPDGNDFAGRVDEEDPDDEEGPGKYEPLSVKLAKYYVRSRRIKDLDVISNRIKAALPERIRRFLYGVRHPDANDIGTVDIDRCPPCPRKVAIYRHAVAEYYAPSECCSPGGMHTEYIRCHPSWHGQYERCDTVLIQVGEEDDVMGGMLIGRVVCLCSFEWAEKDYSCALVEWYLPDSDEPDPITNMWIVKPEEENGERTLDLVHLDSIVRSCHIIPAYGRTRLPPDFHHSYSHTAFDTFYFNKYADYHTFETYPLL